MQQKRVPLCKPYQPKKPRKDKLIAGWDIETDGLGGAFIAGTTYLETGEKQLFLKFDDLIAYIFDRPEYIWLAHNASGYEFSYLAGPLHEMFLMDENIHIDMTYQGESRLIQFRITITYPDELIRGKPKKVTIDMRDTLCLWPMSLAEVAKAFCPEIPKLKHVINFEKETFNPNNPDHLAYAYRDSEILVMAYKKYSENIRTIFGSTVGLTAGSTALKAFVQSIPEGTCYWRDRKSESFIRKAYYGGLVLPGHRIGEWGPTGCIDVNAAYGYQMKIHEFPIGASLATHTYIPEWVGFYHVLATVPEKLFFTLGFNPVPRKDKNGLCWPTGTFETYISTPEIEYARSVGCTIEVLCGYVFPRTAPVFKEFMEKCEEWEVAENGRYKQSVKPQRNSLYGKFGSKEKHAVLKFGHEWKHGTEPVLDKRGRMIPGLYTEVEELDAPYMLIHWAALITAYERIYLMKFVARAYQLGASTVYTDTDSLKMPLHILMIMLENKEIPVGTAYGEFKVEETFTSFILDGGKCFCGTTQDGIVVTKAKGLPKRLHSPEIFAEAVNSVLGNGADVRRELVFYGVEKPKNIFKAMSKVGSIKRRRKLTDIRNSYAWTIDSVGNIYPLGYQYA